MRHIFYTRMSDTPWKSGAREDIAGIEAACSGRWRRKFAIPSTVLAGHTDLWTCVSTLEPQLVGVYILFVRFVMTAQGELRFVRD